MKEIYEKLKEKFDEDCIEFRVGATNNEKTMGLALAYVQARAIQNRLDEVLGFENWKVSYRQIQGGFLCTLSIRKNSNSEWIEKEDGASTTDVESVKGGISNSFKRTASIFGIGRYLYDSKNNWFPIKKQGNSYVFIETPKLQLNEDEKSQTKAEQQNNNEIIITFGKYKGHTLEEIYKNDVNYIKYLRDKSNDVNIVRNCEKLLAS